MPVRRPLPSARRPLAAGFVACCALLFAGGCGPDHKARGVVTGKVTAGGKTLTTGTVIFIAPDGRTASAGIDPDGNYAMGDAPEGECQVTVSAPQMSNDPTLKARLTGKGKGPKMPEGPRPPEGVEMQGGGTPDMPAARIPTEVVAIDDKYSKPETSGLKFTVKKGEQHTYNIDLPDGPLAAPSTKKGPGKR